MSNLEKLIGYVRNGKATEFKNTFTDELSNRVADRLSSMKEKIAKTMFAKEEVEFEEETHTGDKEAYQKFFNGMLKKFGVKSASELDDKKKKEFYDAIDAGWEADDEED
jgi:glutamate-1-semialdehyde aminotransferase